MNLRVFPNPSGASLTLAFSRHRFRNATARQLSEGHWRPAIQPHPLHSLNRPISRNLSDYGTKL